MQTQLPTNPMINPLASLMRQPKLKIKLPSQGHYWPAGSLEHTEDGLYPVYSMTAKDELLITIPDAVANGQAVVDVIQNCMPHVKNAWQMPNLDLDAVLIAIRIATYGSVMSVPYQYQEQTFNLSFDLTPVLEYLSNNTTWSTDVDAKDMTLYVRPIDYQGVADSNRQAAETHSIIRMANDREISDTEKSRMFTQAFNQLNRLTVGMINRCVYAIKTQYTMVENPAHIKEFMDNADQEIFQQVKAHIEQMKNKNALPPQTVLASEQLRAAGYESDTVEVKLEFDAGTFFSRAAQ